MTCDPKPEFIYLNVCKATCSIMLRVYFAHVVKGTLKHTDSMFELHNHFLKKNEYFILVNNKWFFSTKWRHPSSLLAGLLVLVSFHLSLFNSDRCCCSCILNYFVFEAMGDVITVLEHPLHPWSSRGMRMRRLCKRFLSPPTSFLKISAVSSFSHSLRTRHRGLWKVSSKDIKRMSHWKPEQSFFFPPSRFNLSLKTS